MKTGATAGLVRLAAEKLSVPRKLKVTLDGEAVDSHLRVALTVEDGVLMGKLTRNGALLIVR